MNRHGVLLDEVGLTPLLSDQLLRLVRSAGCGRAGPGTGGTRKGTAEAAKPRRLRAAAAAAPNEGGFIYGHYADVVIQRRAIIQVSIQQLEKEANEAREEVSEAYRELKKYETALEARETREEAELASKEQLELDEVGIRTFTQKLV